MNKILTRKSCQTQMQFAETDKFMNTINYENPTGLKTEIKPPKSVNNAQKK